MRVTRGELLDWYVDGEESAVFVDDHVVVLSALATAIVDIVGEDGADEADCRQRAGRAVRRPRVAPPTR